MKTNLSLLPKELEEGSPVTELPSKRTLLKDGLDILMNEQPLFYRLQLGCTESASEFPIHKDLSRLVLGQFQHLSSYIFVPVKDCCWFLGENWELWLKNSSSGCTKIRQEPRQTQHRNLTFCQCTLFQSISVNIVVDINGAELFVKCSGMNPVSNRISVFHASEEFKKALGRKGSFISGLRRMVILFCCSKRKVAIESV